MAHHNGRNLIDETELGDQGGHVGLAHRVHEAGPGLPLVVKTAPVLVRAFRAVGGNRGIDDTLIDLSQSGVCDFHTL